MLAAFNTEAGLDFIGIEFGAAEKPFDVGQFGIGESNLVRHFFLSFRGGWLSPFQSTRGVNP